MAEHSKIEWTDATWNPITGCSIATVGCINCYAMLLAGTRLAHHPSRAGLTVESKAGPVWNGQVRLNEQWLTQPLTWKRPRMIFVCAHGDLFHESVPDEWIDRVFAVMALSPQHTFQVLTKRAERMRAYMQRSSERCDSEDGVCNTLREIGELACVNWRNASDRWPLPNVWIGVSAERQKEADERIPHLLATPAAVRFVSAEPLLGPIDLRNIPYPSPPEDGRRGSVLDGHEVAGIVGNCIAWIPPLDWVIVGGESGANARPMHPDWARSLRDQCDAAGVPFFFKQWGENVPLELVLGDTREEPWRRYPNGAFDEFGKPRDQLAPVTFAAIGKKRAGRLLDGVTHDAMPQGNSQP